MKLSAALTTLLLLVLAVVVASSGGSTPQVELAVLDESNWDRLAPGGKEVDAIYGDFVLKNRHLTAVVAQPLETRNANMTVRSVAGALIDLTDLSQSDQLSAFYPGRREYPYRAARFAGADGADREPSADVLTDGAAAVSVSAAATDDRPEAVTTYRLTADAAFLEVTTTYTNRSAQPLTVKLDDDLRADGGREDMLKAPNGASNLFWLHDRYWGQAYGIDAPQFRLHTDSNSRTTELTYEHARRGRSVRLEPAESFTLTRRIFPGANLLDVKAAVGRTKGQEFSPVTIGVRDGAGRAIPRARISISQEGKLLGSGLTDRQGKLTTALHPGDYETRVTVLGVAIGDGLSLSVLPDDENTFALELADYKPGTVAGRITNGSGEPISCKVQFLAKDGTPAVDFGPETAEFAVRNVRYAPLGEFSQQLPAGRYDVIISHGPEFDAIFTELTVPPGETVPLTGKLVHSVETFGWVSSDFHSHSSPSGDNTASQLGRVLNLVCEHVEFAPCTEHNRIDTYTPHIESLGVEPFISTVSGIELTGSPLPLNHQNAFPLVHKPRTQDDGAPTTDSSPETQIERLALWDDRSEKLVQQNHPDLGWLFYDRNGDQKPDGGYERSLPLIDVVEIHPVENALELAPFETLPNRSGNNRIFNWLQLLNQGYRIPGVVNTDAHYNFHGSGWLRNWIQSSTDDPAEIRPLEMVRAAEQGRLIMSNGPYLEVTAQAADGKQTVTAGQDLPAADGKVRLTARVQCPNWFDVNRVFVLVNGRIDSRHDYARETQPDAFRSGTLKFVRTMDLELERDAQIVVVTGGVGLELGPVMGESMGRMQPAALSNPIYVDVDGGGFTPNGDTLGAALPVKYVRE